MTAQPGKIDSVRASRDGHEFHEAWIARKSLQLLFPDAELVGIAVEGPQPEEQAGAPAQVVEISDVVLYYGDSPTFRGSCRTSVAQVKYSIAKAERAVRVTDLQKTIAKFARAYDHYVEEFGADAVSDRLDFLIVTNRPIHPDLSEGTSGLAEGRRLARGAQGQARQFAKAAELHGPQLIKFAGKVQFIGSQDALPAAMASLDILLVDWSPGDGFYAKARLGALRGMVRDKAGSKGAGRNVITRPDVLTALGIPFEDELLPCPAALVKVRDVVEREQVAEAVSTIDNLSKPLLVHAAGGIGKTVFLQSVAEALQDRYVTVFFDCFGGGAYRSPEDARHLPDRALIHIVNTLAFQGMCDPILPTGGPLHSLLRLFRHRLRQAAEVVNGHGGGRGIALFVDAIDNAMLEADDRSEVAFPRALLESLRSDPIPGVKVVMSCRSHRQPAESLGYHGFELQPFSRDETTAFLRSRLGVVSESQVRVALARSGGNPRILEYLVEDGGQGVFEESELDEHVELDELIVARIADALADARERGHRQRDIDTFVAGLSVLPPPVPVAEYANALEMGCSEIESFAADLWPLLERTRHGLMFRDEPTETLVRERFAQTKGVLVRLADTLLAQQDSSVYAARALPRLLQQLEDGKRLYDLAISDVTPGSLTTTVAQRSIRYSRLRAATSYATRHEEHDRLIDLLVRLSTVASVNERGIDYVADNPDLIIAAEDADSLRRLFEARTPWPGSRPARLTIAHVIADDLDEGSRYLRSAIEWVDHYLRSRPSPSSDKSPSSLDVAAVSFGLLSLGQRQQAAEFIQLWLPWFSFQVCKQVIELCEVARGVRSRSAAEVTDLVGSLDNQVGCIAALLSFAEMSEAQKRELLASLAGACRSGAELGLRDFPYGEEGYRLEDGLRKAASLALTLGLRSEALAISLRAPHARPSAGSFREAHHTVRIVFPFLFQIALEAAARGSEVHEKDLLPSELTVLGSKIPAGVSGGAFLDAAKEELRALARRPDSEGEDTESLSYDTQRAAEGFLDSRLQPLLKLTRAFSEILSAEPHELNRRFENLLTAWEDTKRTPGANERQRFRLHPQLGLELATFALWAHDGIEASVVTRFIDMALEQGISANRCIRLVQILARRPSQASLAGKLAVRARALVTEETDVAGRSALLAALARSIIPASIDEAVAYYRTGLEQLDAIGSGDYEFAHELLLLAKATSGDELEPRDFHTLMNVCELNMYDAEKFPWGQFARGLARVAGVRGLARLGRWDDRERVSLNYTLLPYLTALVDEGKLDPVDAVALNRLAAPVELYSHGTDVFATSVVARGGSPAVISELIKQFEDDNRGSRIPSAADLLVALSRESDRDTDETAWLSAARARSVAADALRNKRSSGPIPSLDNRKSKSSGEDEEHPQWTAVIAASDPTDQQSLQNAIESIRPLSYPSGRIDQCFSQLRADVPFKFRARYLRSVCRLENVSLLTKLAELETCREAWAESSAALDAVLAEEQRALVRLHVSDLVGSGISRYILDQLNQLTGAGAANLALQLIEICSSSQRDTSGTAWLALAALIAPKTSNGHARTALMRLLRTEAARLADSVRDGAWSPGLYPERRPVSCLSGLIWRRLGSPYAANRWLAGHCLRTFARHDRWDVIDSVVDRAADAHARPFQADELHFYFFHARLWLLITLARLSLDHPKNVSRYRTFLLGFFSEDQRPHVLMRHFAATTLINCADSGTISLPDSMDRMLRDVDRSPHPRNTSKQQREGGVFARRPESAPEPLHVFSLDYDFEKYEVDALGEVFGKPLWELRDRIAEHVHGIDPLADSMYGYSERGSPYRHGGFGMTPEYHSYGQQLGWHALMIVAAELLGQCAVVESRWSDQDPWEEWLRRHLLTRDDGYWLSDGTDRRPPHTIVNLVASSDEGLAITGDRDQLLQQAWATDSSSSELAVEGRWMSADGLTVTLSSALAPSGESKSLAMRLTEEEPFSVWLPHLTEGDDGSEHVRSQRDDVDAWVVLPSREVRLDGLDPLASPTADSRSRIATAIARQLHLRSADRFDRRWLDEREEVGLRAIAWGFEDPHPRHETADYGRVLLAYDWLLRDVLQLTNRHLLLVIRLERYERGVGHQSGRFSHTVGVCRVDEDLRLEYFEGKVNFVHRQGT